MTKVFIEDLKIGMSIQREVFLQLGAGGHWQVPGGGL